MDIPLTEVVSVLEKVEGAIIGTWIPTSANFERIGIYKAIANFITGMRKTLGLNSEVFTHAELGTGFGFLMGHMRKLVPQATLIGIDSSPTALRYTDEF